MGSIVVLVAIVVLTAWLARRIPAHRRASAAAVVPPAMSHKDLAHKAFVHGNTCLKEEKFAEAIDAFQQARELQPTHPHIAGRLAEAERQQQEASALVLTSATG